jgi:ATP/maltotriose-dependent transcriptional regulator MalT
MLGLAVAQAGDAERAATLMHDAADAFEAAGDNWGAAATSLIRAIGAAHAGDVSAAAAMTRAARRHADAIAYDAFRVPTFLFEAWVAQRHKDGAAAEDAYGRALELAGRVGFGDHAAFALVGLGSHALAEGDLRRAEALEQQALETADAAHATSIAAYARVVLARIAAASGDDAVARQLYEQVLEWSQTERPHEARESLFLALAGSPAAAAELGLTELGETALA